MAIRFTANYDDLSTDRGFQFRFKCDKCGSGHMTAFQPSITGTVGGLFRAAGTLFGGALRKAGDASYEVQRATGGKAHDDALAKAVAECKGYFKQCTRCGKWVCPDVCWNASAGLCESCAPDMQEEMAAGRAKAMSDAARAQLQEKAQRTDYVADVDMKAGGAAPKASMACPQCGAKTSGGKFCPDCGATLAAKTTCAGCGHVMDGKPKFCPECGAKT
jgi:double zinc ribbon protein